ncbi:POC1 centriolar protein homolog [Cimex lectularius]|uniref:WD repeat-containing protein 55 homolog n=1 Tax=Cimex lectularius TaxID=79782 RepID=A0A8I6TMG0_CIMLE|nr:POC1 centriolar protein homolog [Cimex lectularius]
MEWQDPVLEQHFIGHGGTVTCLAFSPSGKQLASASLDKTFMNWNLASSKGSLRYRAKPLPVTHVTFSPSGNLIGSSQGQFVRMWMASIQGKSLDFKAHTSTIRSVRFSPDGRTFVTASDDKCIKIWRTSRRKFVASLIGHTNWVRFANFSYDGNQIVSCSDDKSVRLWDTRISKQIHIFNEIKDCPLHVDFHPAKTYIGVAVGKNIKIYDMRYVKLLQYYPCHDGEIYNFSFHPNGNFMLTGSEDKTSKIIDLIEGRPVLSLEGHTEAVTAVTFSQSGSNFATGSKDKNVFVWKTNLEHDRKTEEKFIKNINGYRKAKLPKLSSREVKSKSSWHTLTTDECSNGDSQEFDKLSRLTSCTSTNIKSDKECTTDATTDDPYDHEQFQNEDNQPEIVDKENLVKICLNGAGTNIKPIENSIGTLLTSVDTLSNRMNELEKKISMLEILNTALDDKDKRHHSY